EWLAYDEVFANGCDLFIEDDTVMGKATNTGVNGNMGWPGVPARKNGDNRHVVASAITDVLGHHEGWAGLVRITGLARGKNVVDLPLSRPASAGHGRSRKICSAAAV